MKKFMSAIMVLLMGAFMYGCSSSSTTEDSYDYDSDYNSYDSDYDSYDYDSDYDSYDYDDSDGYYGYGEQYDEDVYDAAEAFGEDPDHVNDVYEALAEEMR